MGNGVTRPATSFSTYDGSARLGGALSNNWRLDGSFNGFVGRDIFTPGDVFDGENNQGSKDLERWTGDIRLSGQRGTHLLTATAFVASDQQHSSRVTSTNPADIGFLPYLSYEREDFWRGLQVRDTWNWRSGNSVSVGADYEWVSDKSKSYLRTGDRRGPFSADNTRTTIGLYAENTVRLNDGATVVSLGARLDHITTETFATAFKTGFTPSAAGFTSFNPSVGFKQELTQDVRLHATVGRAFVPPAAYQLTGFFEGFRGGQPHLTQGNPGLRPERSTGYDVGVEWFGRAGLLDVTYFQTHVADRVVGGVVISNPGPPAPVVVSYVNSLGSRMYGMELDYSHSLSSHVTVFSNVTHYFSRREELPNAGERNILNVASNTVRVGVDLDFGGMSSRLSARYVEGRQDNDWNVAGIPIIDYPDFTVVDFTTRYQVANAHALLLEVNNLLDEYYYEKKGFPLSGIAFALKYQLDFGQP
ncbi:MAG: TonB-dependent receptor [Gammaproteobacteria bacterium]|nr:TonB-dependent receptor [Gammaproteobacteria bacterium]